MTTAEQRILVCEKLGWKVELSESTVGNLWRLVKPDGNVHSSFPWAKWMMHPPTLADCLHSLPPLTLDWLHECWLNLTPEQKLNCISQLLELILTDEYVGTYRSMIALEDATAEQRLAALVETLKQSQPVLPAKQS